VKLLKDVSAHIFEYFLPDGPQRVMLRKEGEPRTRHAHTFVSRGSLRNMHEVELLLALLVDHEGIGGEDLPLSEVKR
jgi:hypothetical protein